jgi:hypothetical protein
LELEGTSVPAALDVVRGGSAGGLLEGELPLAALGFLVGFGGFGGVACDLGEEREAGDAIGVEEIRAGGGGGVCCCCDLSERDGVEAFELRRVLEGALLDE